MVDLNKVNFNTKNLASSQLKIMGSFEDASQLQSYITQIQTIKTASRGLFKPTPIADYANAIHGLEARQAALLLSTQGLTNAQIAETLAINESSIAKNYQAMADAGLLKHKQTLTAVQVQENLQTVLGAEADTSAAMSALGLSGAIEGQGYQTVKLTAKKLEEAVATNVLTEAQAKELAMRTGVTLSMTAQAAGSLPKWIAMIKAGTIAVWDQVKATVVWLATTPTGWAVSAAAAIGGLIFTLDKLAQSEKKASDHAVELYENSKEKVKTNQEETDSLNELIEKYKELKSNSNLSSDNRNEIKQLQHDIAQLVGTEAQNLDLVNGKLDEQISKLQSIQAEKSKQNVEDARDNYYNAVYASDVITGGADKYGNDVSIKWSGAEARQIHKIEGFEHTKYNDLVKFFNDNGFGDIVRKNDNQTVMNMRLVVDTKDIDDIEQKIARLKEFKEFLADNGFKNTGLYQGITSSIDRYSDQQNNELEAADILVNNIIENLSDSNEKLQAVRVESVQSFEEYRKKMLEELLKDNDISTALSSGLLSKEDLQKSIDEFMATCEDFSTQYEQWQSSIMGQKQDFDSPLSLSDLLNTEDLADTKKELIELAKAGELTPETFNSTKEYRDLLQQTGLTAKQAYLEMMNLDDFDMDLSDWQSQLQNARSNISELNDMMDELTSKDSAGLSLSSVDKIISDFPQLLQYLNDTPHLIEEINSLLNGQKDIANDAANQILEYSSSAYIQMRDTAQAAINDITIMQNGQVQSVAQMYGIDLNNYSSLAQAKKAIELALLGTLNEGWAQHFGVVIDSLTGMAKITQSLDGSDPRTAEALSQISAYNELMTRLNSAKKNFESNIDYGSVGVDKFKSKGSDKKETDKWLEEYKKKLAELQNMLDKGKRICPLL